MSNITDHNHKEEIENLSAQTVDVESQHFDFSEGHPEKWDVALPMTEEERMNERYHPMMNYLWGLPEDFEPKEEHKEQLDNMTIVAIKERTGYPEYYLALTGGGMDMSWQIARTYVNLGYLPPTAIGTLPEIAGMDFDNPENRKVIEALKKSHEVNRNNSEYALSRLEELGDQDE